ncbi:MAG: GNAT family N-acetyltransferase [Eggerthellaceae bacterium]|nr:GNAT family N-acetyltransferase [Eggerthellaceae bacterium]
MALSFVPVKSKEDQKLLADIAGKIWRGYWPTIIGEAQTEYMIEQFQSYKAIRKYMKKHDYEYWFLVATETDDNAEPVRSIVGFTGGRSEAGTNRFFISKIYLHPKARGHGYARSVVEFYKDLCFARGHTAMYLTVNKHNDLGIRAYKGTGFETIDSVETDIGHGFIMDDYVMQLDL